MRVERSFASNNVNPGTAGVPVDGSILAAPYLALSRGASAIGSQVVDYAQATIRRDASAITADTLTSIQEETNRQYLEAQQHVTSNAEDPDNVDGVSNIDAVVRFPSTSNIDPRYNGKPFSEYMLNSYDERVKEKLSKIKNPVALADLRSKLATFRNQLGGQSLDFEARATFNFRKDLIGKAGDRSARLVYDNPGLFDDQAAMMTETIAGARIGADGPGTRDKILSQLAVATAEGWIEVDPVKAKELLSTEETSFRKHLDANQVSALKNQADTALNQVLAEERTSLSLMEASHKQSLLETGQGIAGYEERLKRAYANQPEVLANKLEEYAIYQGSYNHKTVMDGMTISQLNDYARQQRPVSGDEQFARKAQVADFLDNYAAEQIKMAQDDPGLLVEQLNQKKFDQAQSIQDRSKLRLSLQVQKGIPEHRRRMMSNAERDGMIQTIQNAEPNQVLGIIQNFTNELDGGNPLDQTLSGQFFRELTAKKDGLSPTYNVLLQNVRDGSPVAFDLVRSLNLAEPLKQFMTKDSEKAGLMSAIDSRMRNWSEGIVQGQAENIQVVQEMQKVAFDLAKMYMLDQNLSEGRAADRAVSQLVNDKLSLSNGPLQIPKYIYDQGRKIAAAPASIVTSLKEAKVMMTRGELPDVDLERTFAGVPSFVDEKTKKEIQNIAIKRGYWKTNEDYTGAYFMVPLTNGDLPVLSKNGEPLVMPFDKAQNRNGRKPFKWDVDMFVEPRG